MKGNIDHNKESITVHSQKSKLFYILGALNAIDEKDHGHAYAAIRSMLIKILDAAGLEGDINEG